MADDVADPDATVLRPPGRALDLVLDTTVGVATADSQIDLADAPTVVVRTDDSDATVIRNTRVQPPGTREATTDRTRPQGTTLRPLPRQALALPKGTLLHEYRIERVLGQGGFGITYLATDVNLDAEVAIKEYLPEEIAFRAGDRSVMPNASAHRDRYDQGLQNFLAEARTLASFRHPNIVRVARFFESNRTAYMVLEYERGRSFKKWWAKQVQSQRSAPPASPQQAETQGERLLVERLQPLLDGLQAVHAAGYLHRDIKPDNIQVRAEDGRMVLLDFGSAGQTVALADQDAVVLTPGYAPIEQYGLGEQGAWTDVYAFAATLYWAVSGHKPPDAEARAAGISLLPAVEAGKGRFGRSFLEAIDWALNTDPAARPQTVQAWSARLLADHVSSLGIAEALQHEDSRIDEPALAPGVAGVAGAVARRRGQLTRHWRRWRLPSSWPLALRLALAMVATALLPMLATGLYNLQGAQTALERAKLQHTEGLARSTAGRIGQLADGGARLARGLAGDVELQQWLGAPAAGAPALLEQRLAALVQANPDIQLVMVMDRMGNVRLSTDPELPGRNFAFREYFQRALAGRSFNTGIVVGAGAGAAGIFYAEPVRLAPAAATGDQTLGAVVLRQRAAAVAAILDDVGQADGMAPFLLDADGVIVQHPQAGQRFRSLVPLSAEVQQRLREDQRFRLDRVEAAGEHQLAAALQQAAGRGGHVAYVSGDGSEHVAGYAPVPGQRWTVVVAQPREAFEAPLATLMTHLQISLVLAGLLFVGLALRFARHIVRPVQALTAATRALKAGQYEQAYVDTRTVGGRDELGRLARTFNVMVDVLRQRERERRSRRP